MLFRSPIVTGFGLFHHLDETLAPPTPFLTIDGASRFNPAYLSWLKQDQLLLGWLRSSISGPVLGQHVSCRTSHELWSSLHRIYSAVSRARVMELRCLLQTTTRGGQSCSEYPQIVQTPYSVVFSNCSPNLLSLYPATKWHC